MRTVLIDAIIDEIIEVNRWEIEDIKTEEFRSSRFNTAADAEVAFVRYV